MTSFDLLLATCAPHTEPEFGGNLIHMSRGLVTAAGVPARWSRIDGLASWRDLANHR
jgi:hypothetical protein